MVEQKQETSPFGKIKNNDEKVRRVDLQGRQIKLNAINLFASFDQDFRASNTKQDSEHRHYNSLLAKI